MEGNGSLTIVRAIVILSIICALLYLVEAEESKLSTYIVHVKLPAEISLPSEDLDTWYESLLPQSVASSTQERRIIHTYRNALAGFAAKLTAEEAKAMQEKDEILYAVQEKVFSFHTTHTPSFLGLNRGLGFWNSSNLGKGIIIGVIDSGTTPGHPSFGDEGMPPPPAKWKGKCEFTEGCNNKLIGARNFAGSDPPLDDLGHGTHTSSTAAGNFVAGANILGMASGTASGMAPMAHVAMYKVGSRSGLLESNIVAGMDAAIGDGVDVLSLSLGGFSSPFYSDGIAIGAFAAIERGIVVSCSAGNGGPSSSTLSNEAPWILTVGASTTDRSLRATARLGNGQEFDGQSLYQPKDFPATLLPLVYPGASGNQSVAQCVPGSLNGTDVKDKVVVCDVGGGIGTMDKGQEVKGAGGAAMILLNGELEGFTTFVEDLPLPASQVSYVAGLAIKEYVNQTSNPTATIVFKGTIIGSSTDPAMAFFSSRGPSLASPGILKPDITGPGVNILAAWPFPLDNSSDTKSIFFMESGTSMSCPHLAGITALIKSAHPDWSPAVIKSAIMTSADITNLGGKPITDQNMEPADIFAVGSGHVNPTRANDPGLVYDIEPADYLRYLCGLGYSDSQVGLIVKQTVECSAIKPITESELNYPSITVKLGSNSTSVGRTVTNVGPAQSTYTSVIINPPGVDVSVGPGKLSFTEVNQTISYDVTFSKISGWNQTATFAQGYLNWVSDAKHTVRTPLVVVFQ